MPRPHALEIHARCYKKDLRPSRCHGLAPWSFTFVATKRVFSKLFKMPRPCAVESHARCYKESFFETLQDATALRRGVSRSLLQREFFRNSSRCHGLAPWSLTLAATERVFSKLFKMPRPCAMESHARCYKDEFFSKLFKMPRPCAVESHARCYKESFF